MSEQKQIPGTSQSEENKLPSELQTLKISSKESEAVKESETVTNSSEEVNKKNPLTLISSDGEEFVVDEAAGFQSVMIKNAIEDCKHGSVALANVDGKTLTRIIEYWNKHAEGEGDLEKFDDEFLDVDTGILYDLIMAANYLDSKELLEKICMKVANMIKGKKPEEIRAIFQIDDDFGRDREEQMRAENPWAFQ